MLRVGEMAVSLNPGSLPGVCSTGCEHWIRFPQDELWSKTSEKSAVLGDGAREGREALQEQPRLWLKVCKYLRMTQSQRGAAGAVDRQGTACLAEVHLLSLQFGVKIRSRFLLTEDSENW